MGKIINWKHFYMYCLFWVLVDGVHAMEQELDEQLTHEFDVAQQRKQLLANAYRALKSTENTDEGSREREAMQLDSEFVHVFPHDKELRQLVLTSPRLTQKRLNFLLTEFVIHDQLGVHHSFIEELLKRGASVHSLVNVPYQENPISLLDFSRLGPCCLHTLLHRYTVSKEVIE